MTILACREQVAQLGRHDIALAVIVLRVVGQQHAQPVADGDAGRDDQGKVSEKRASCGLARLLRVCQAMSMAMTTVLPEPVAILNAVRGSPGFDESFPHGVSRSLSMHRRISLPLPQCRWRFQGLRSGRRTVSSRGRDRSTRQSSAAVVGVTPT